MKVIDYSSASMIFEKGLGFLLSFGFQGPSVRTESSKLIGDSLLMTFSSEKVQRYVEISYIVAQKGHPNTIVALVIANDQQRFSVKDWLTVNGMAGAIQFSTIDTPNLIEEAFIEQFCQAFEMIVRRYLIDVLAGRMWEEVPIDWKGYR